MPPFRVVEIDERGNGRVLHFAQWHCSIAHHVVFLLAGAAGEVVWSGRPVLEVCAAECIDDWQTVQAALRQDRSRHLSLDVLAEQSRALVAAHWGDVEAVATALLARERLDYAEVLQILGRRA